MIFSDDELNEISKYSAAFLAPAEIAVLLDYPIQQFCDALSDELNPAFTAYHKARLQKIFDIRAKTVSLAERGSSSAVESVEILITEQLKKQRDAKI